MKHLLPYLSPCLLGALAYAPAAIAQDATPQNIAQGVAYRVSPANQSDRKAPPALLTDGLFAADPIWDHQQQALRISANRPVSLTFDLKERKPIDGIAISTAAGLATSGKDVNAWPGVIDIYTSDDNRTYYHVGELLSLNDAQGRVLPEFGSYSRRKIAAHGLKTHGRYIKLVFSHSRTLFLDEVEIYRGEDRLLSEARNGPTLRGDEEIFKQVAINAPNVHQEQPETEAAQQAKRERLFELAIRRRYLTDIEALSTKAKQLPAPKAAPILSRLETLRQRALNEAIQLSERNTLPVGPIGREILAQQAAIWQSEDHAEGVTLWPSDHWGFLHWLQEPEWSAAPKLQLSVLNGESRSFSFNITNNGTAEATLQLKISGIDTGAAAITVHPVEWTESPWRLAVASALPEAVKAGESYSISVPAGGTRQVWFTAKGGAQSGEAKGRVEVLQEGKAIAEVPLKLTVYPMAFPEKPALHHSGFECASNDTLRRRYGVFKEARPEFLNVMRNTGADAPWATRTEFAFGRFNSEHRYASEKDAPETSHLREWVGKAFPSAYRYHVALTVKTPDRRAVIDGCDYAKDPEGFQQRINHWLGFWKKEVEALGRKPEEFYLKIIDEPGFNSAAPYAEDEVIAIWAKAIHASGTGFKVFLNPIYDEPWGANEEVFNEADVICVKYSHFLRFGERYRDFYLKRGAKQELSIYECYGAPGHLYDPYSYFRLQAWMAWELGASTMFFWNYADSGTGAGFVDSWNTGHNQWYYTPLFITPDSIVTSKQMVAIHEGTADYQILALLRDAAERQKGTEAKAELVAQAETLMKRISSEVLAGSALNEPRWMWPNATDRTPADKLREEALQLLAALQ